MAKKIYTISKDRIKSSNNAVHSSNYKPNRYYSNFLNTVNKDAHSTRPETVGKLATEIFPNYVESATDHSPDDWKKYYQGKYSKQYNEGLNKFRKKFEEEKSAINQITEQDLVDYYDDLMFHKTFVGLYAEKEILKDIAAKKKAVFRKSTADEESRGIDGFIDNIPYSVKPETYRSAAVSNTEIIDAKMVYYTQNKTTKNIDYYIDGEDEK